MTRQELQVAVDRNLDVAVDENGYRELLHEPAEIVATDLCECSQEFEDMVEGTSFEELVACVAVWQKRRLGAWKVN